MLPDKHTVIGDSHNGGKSVEHIKNDITEYIHKPRNAAVEHAFEAFLLGLRQEGFIFTPKCEKIIGEGDDWHNAEIVRHSPAENIDDVVLYCKRCGALIFLAYFLGSIDLHIENIIASKDSPVLIDLETLLSGQIDNRRESVKYTTLTQFVLKSHLLPNWILIDGKPFDCGGLTGVRENSQNILMLNGKSVDLYDFESEVISGFTEAYTFTLSHKETVLKLVELFSECHFRQILRPTETYDKIINLIKSLDSDKSRSFTEALLRRAYENDIDPDRMKKVYKAYLSEVESVLRGDIPFFYVSGNGTSLCDFSGPVLDNFLTLSPVAFAKKKIESLSVSDMENQKRIINQSLSAVRPAERKHSFVGSKDNACDTVFNILERHSISSLTSQWMMLEASYDGNIFLQSVGLGLYDGLLGILCCYAAIYNKTRNTDIFKKLISHYEPYRKLISDKDTVISNPMDCSIQSGFAGRIMSLIHISELTGEKLFYNDAVSIASHTALSITNGSEIGDFLCGIPGIAACLPKLPSDISERFAKLLLPILISYEPSLTGVAHGAAGIALSLAAVQKALNISSYDDKIISLLEFENSFYDECENNWRDLRDTEKVGFMDGWCSGAPGIGMSRKRLCEYTENRQIIDICKSDIEKSVKRLGTQKLSKRDSLCCGNASKLMAGSFLGVNMTEIYNYLENNLKYDMINIVHPIDTCDINSGLMQGIAGIGYALAMYGDEKSGGMIL